MTRPMRRVVTGHDAHGKSIIVMDGPSPHVLELPGMPGLARLALEALRGAGIELPPEAWISVADGHAFTLDEGGALVAELTATVEPLDAASAGSTR